MADAADNKELFAIDKSDMFTTLKEFPQQIKQAVEIGKGIDIASFGSDSKNYMILGMGGSAIGGELLKSYFSDIKGTKGLNLQVIRDYKLPTYAAPEYNFIASSYSGNTEETVSAFDQAASISKNIICLTTGGKLEKSAREKNLVTVILPGGLMPRNALAYSFFPMLFCMMKTNHVEAETKENIGKAIKEVIEKISDKAKIYAVPDDNNPAWVLANKLKGSVPVIYSSNERMDAVNIRWRGQIQENAKNLCFGNQLPEMNHNEINSWANPLELSGRFKVVLLRDVDNHSRVKLRFEAIKEIFNQKNIEYFSYYGEGQFLLTRMFDLVYLGDWTSYYLALLNGEDPTPIPAIDFLKSFLNKK